MNRLENVRIDLGFASASVDFGNLLGNRDETCIFNPVDGCFGNGYDLPHIDLRANERSMPFRLSEATSALSLGRLEELSGRYPDNRYLKELVETFDTIDKDRNCKLSPSETREALQQVAERHFSDLLVTGTTQEKIREEKFQFETVVSKLRVGSDARLRTISDVFARSLSGAEANAGRSLGGDALRSIVFSEQGAITRKQLNGGLTRDDLQRQGELVRLSGVQGNGEFLDWASDQERFLRFDRNKDGRLSIDESNEARTAFNHKDEKGFTRGDIDKLLMRLPNNEYLQDLLSNFDKADADGNLFLTPEEARQAVRRKAEDSFRGWRENGASGDELRKSEVAMNSAARVLFDKSAFAGIAQDRTESNFFNRANDSFRKSADPVFRTLSEMMKESAELADRSSDGRIQGSQILSLVFGKQGELTNKQIHGGLTREEILRQGELLRLSGIQGQGEFNDWIGDKERFKAFDQNNDGKLDIAENNSARSDFNSKTVSRGQREPRALTRREVAPRG